MLPVIKLLSKNRIIRLLLNKYRRYVFQHSMEYHRFCTDLSDKRLIFMSDIDHGNLGDHAIVYAEHKLLEDMADGYRAYNFGRKSCLTALDLIEKNCRETDIVLIPGGGWAGTLWKASGELFIDMIKRMNKAHIIIFPQTIFFEDTPYGLKQKKQLFQAIQSCRDIVFCVRERKSYDFLVSEMPNQNERIQYCLYPDIVLLLHPEIQCVRSKKVLIVMRKDRECIVDTSMVNRFLLLLKKKGYQSVTTDTVLSKHVKTGMRETELKKKWKEFASSELVLTDRLHGMIFSVITQTPCIVFDNSSHKVKGVYSEWLTGFANIFFVPDCKEDTVNIERALDQFFAGIKKEEPVCLNKIFNEMKENILQNIENIQKGKI